LFSTSYNRGPSLVWQTKKLNPLWFTGFADGESCFHVRISKSNGLKINYQVQASFQIEIHQKDIVLLEKIQSFFGVGSIRTSNTRDSVMYYVSSVKELNKITQHFDKYPLITQKQADYLLFKQALKIIESKEHPAPHL